MAIKTFPLILKWAHMETSNVRHLAFATEDGQAFNFTPGQFISIHFEHEGKMLRRSYSIASIPGKTDLIEIAISYFAGGAASEYLFNLEPGTEIQASGPFGRLVLRDEQPKRYIMVATGTGVTPYRSMLPELNQRLNADANLEVIVYLGVQTRKDALYSQDFIDFAKDHPNFKFNIYYSRENLEEHLDYEHTGYVQSGFDELHLDPEKDIIYLCGNPGMIDNAVALVKDLGFPIQQVRREKYVS